VPQVQRLLLLNLSLPPDPPRHKTIQAHYQYLISHRSPRPMILLVEWWKLSGRWLSIATVGQSTSGRLP
jgi:hypothetical protein